MRVTLDFETYSKCDLKECGAYVYSLHPSTTVLMLSYRVMGVPFFWAPGMPAGNLNPLWDAIEEGFLMEAHNSLFERWIWENVCVKRHGWPEVPPQLWRCTMAQSAYKALPLSLDTVGDVLQLETPKDKEGAALVKKLCKPQHEWKQGERGLNATKADLDRLGEYCETDTAAEEELSERTGPLPPRELRVWQLDQEINCRGIAIDQALVARCKALFLTGVMRANQRMSELTDGAVGTVDQLPKLKEWCCAQGVTVDSLAKDALDERIDALKGAPGYADVFEALTLRRDYGKAAVKKLAKMASCVAPDGRARGLLQYHGATTGRWAGRLVQPQNLTRPTFDVDPDLLLTDESPDTAVDKLEMIYGGSIAEIVANVLRKAFIAGPGKKLVACDFSGIESRVLAWLFGEEWKLDVFRAQDRGEGGDNYCAFAEKVVGRPVGKKDPERQTIGKPGELAFGFEGGVGAWRKFDSSDRFTDEEVNAIKNQWRDAHPRVRAGWKGVNNAFIAAVQTGQPCTFGRVTFGVEGDWAYCLLPSDRKIWYYRPRIMEVSMPWDDEDLRPAVVFWAYKQTASGGRAWCPITAYGGLLTENIVQAVARDLMVDAMFACRRKGIPIVLTVHDELVCEVDEDDARALDTLTRIMKQSPLWCADMPINAEGWQGKRYRK